MSLGLDRVRALMDALGNPHDQLRFVHVAGTNGKGSVCAFVESILRAAGYKTGLFTSPYIVTFEERIRVCGQNISAADLRAATLRVRQAAALVEAQLGEHPTEFELMFAVAMVHFAAVRADIVVCEVGLGGRLDATNVIAPDVCAITQVGLDHVAILGNTVAEIAAEKAGIIKPGVPVVVYPQEPAAAAVIEQAASRADAPLAPVNMDALRVGTLDVSAGVRHFMYAGRKFKTALLGDYQPKNAACAIDICTQLAQRGWNIPASALEAGIADARWPGRFEVARTAPLCIIDGAHNPAGAAVLASTLTELAEPGERAVTFVIGVLADKDYAGIVHALVPFAGRFITFTPPNPRALSAQALAQEITTQLADQGAECSEGCGAPAGRVAVTGPEGSVGVPVTVCETPAEAVHEAISTSSPEDIIVTCGSLYAIAQIKQTL
jgi:dihydrofolate synthase/folylpolyglutamate synthase